MRVCACACVVPTTTINTPWACVCARVCVCVCVFVCVRAGACVCVRERVCVCVRERVSAWCGGVEGMHREVAIDEGLLAPEVGERGDQTQQHRGLQQMHRCQQLFGVALLLRTNGCRVSE